MTYISEALRRIVHTRSQDRCEYCHLQQRNTFFNHQVDHIIAEKHGGKTIEENLCTACAECNRHKGSDLCSYDTTESITPLFNPRLDIWEDHFTLKSDGNIQSLTAKSRATIKLLHFNDPEFSAERQGLMSRGKW
jgi:hypothetical protein